VAQTRTSPCRQQTLILVTHSPDLVTRYARRTVRLLDGRVATDTAVAGGIPGAGERPGAGARP
jgi:ABC-type thiamine transport system ATPase subunit